MSNWPPRADEVFKCIHTILQNSTACSHFPIAICQSVCLSLNTSKEVTQVFGPGLSVGAGDTVWSNAVELEDVNDIAFTIRRNAGHCGLSVTASLETSPDSSNWDTLAYAGFTNLIFAGACVLVGLTPLLDFPGQGTLPITTGPVYMRARVENESMNDIIIQAWLTVTKTC